MISYKEFTARWSDLHGGAEIQGAVALWLRVSYFLVKPLALLRFTPNALTLIGLFSAVAMIWAQYLIQILVLLIVSLICDGLDGSLAIYRDRVSRMGGIYDSLADRISEAIWLFTTTWLGLSFGWAISIWVLGATQEYARARLASLGYAEIGVITPTERPMRAIFVVVILFMYLFDSPYIAGAAAFFLALQIVSFAMVMRMARSIIK